MDFIERNNHAGNENFAALIRDAVNFAPKISIIMPVTDPAALQSCMENIFSLNFPEYEFIVVNCGERIQSPNLPNNFRIINYPGATVANALNLGLKKSAGEYILFKDETSFLLPESLDIAAELIEVSEADVIHFAAHVELVGDGENLVNDDAPELNVKEPGLLDLPRQLRADLFLQKKFSPWLDTKLFRKEFLMRLKLKFTDEISEFLFQALIQADKYLLVPQVFCVTK